MSRRKKKASRGPIPTGPLPTGPLPTESEHTVGGRWLAAVFLLALAYRGLCFADAGGHPLYRYPIVDAGYHDAWAKRIVAGDWLGHGPDDVFKPPLYAYAVAGLYAVCGRHIETVQWAQHILGALSCVLLAILAGRLLGRATGRAAGMIAAVYAPLVFFESQLLSPSAAVFLNIAALLVLTPPRREPRAEPATVASAARDTAGGKRSGVAPAVLGYGRLAAAGLLFGLSAGVRPDVILPAVLVLTYLLFANRGTLRRRLAAGGLCLATAAAVVLPISLRNYQLTGEWILVSNNAGINFYVGNSAAADGTTAVPVGLRWEKLIARVPQETLLKPASASRWWTRAALREMIESPASALLRLGRKGLAFVNHREFRNNICYHYMQTVSAPLRWSPLQFAAVLPLAACGLICMRRGGDDRKRRAFLLCVLWVVGYWAVGVAFFVTARFRLPAAPMLILPAAWALVQIAAAVGQQQWKRLLGYLAVVAFGGVLCWPRWFGPPRDGWVRDEVNLGNSLRESEDLPAAQEAYGRALVGRPQDPDAHYLLARLLLPRDPAAAMQHLEAARAVLPDSPDLLLALGQTHLALHDGSRARERLHELLRLAESSNLWPKRAAWATAHLLLADLEPEAATVHREKAWSIDPRSAAEAAFLRHRDLPRVLKTFRAEANERFWDWYSQANYGMVLLELGRAREAATALHAAVRLAPERQAVRFHLARALWHANRKERALEILDELYEELPRCPLRDRVGKLRERINTNADRIIGEWTKSEDGLTPAS